MNGHRFRTIAVVALLLLSGCLPYSCRRQESTALTPADSLSRTLVSSIPMDTLALAWARPIGDDRGGAYPRTVRFGHAQTGPIYLGDAEQALVFVFDLSGEPVDTFATASIPYLTGVRGDTVAVFEPGAPAMHFFVRGAPVGTVPIQDAERSQTALVYGAFGGTAGHHAIYYKRVDPEAGGFIAEIDPSGNKTTRWPLPGPYWRHAGMLRFWGDSLLSLSGFRPVVDVIVQDGTLDTLALHGFDSPMLARSHSWMQGEIHEAPLLTPSAAAENDLLFVLNLRAGWLRIDAFDRTGRLVHRLTEPDHAWDASFFPQDLAVRSRADGTYIIAVAVSSPDPELRLYRWRPSE